MQPRHIACFCDPGNSHVMNFAAIGRELQDRGHRFTVFQAAELAPKISAEGIGFYPLPTHGFSIQHYIDLVAHQQGASPSNFIDYASKSATMFCEEAPAALTREGVDGVLVDMSEPGGATAAESLGLPFITICNAVPLHGEPGVPPDFLPWNFSPSPLAHLRNRTAYAVRDFIIRPLHKVLNRYRSRWSLRPYRSPEDSFSPYAQITQLVPEFDFPRRRLPACFHYVGPYRRAPHKPVPFPYERLDGRPLLYASLGTVLGGRIDLWRAIAQAATGIDAQLVISLGGVTPPPDLPAFPPGTIVVDYAPQRDLLSRAALAITHAGLNSVMEALTAGTPLLAIPITGDQFGVAARISYTQVGEVVPASRCTAAALSSALRKLLSTPAYRQREAVIQAAIGNTRGTLAVADIVEEAVTSRQPVLRDAVATSS